MAYDPANWPEKRLESKFGVVPYGYNKKEGDPKSLVPNIELIELIEQALDQIDAGASVRTAHEWLLEASLVPVSHMTLSKLWKRLRGQNPENQRAQKLQAMAELKAAPKTREERKRRTLNQKIGAEKRKLTTAAKRVQALIERKTETQEAEDKVQALLSTYTLDTELPEEITETPFFEAHPGPQRMFLAASEQEVLYGGAAGGGKSFGLLADPMRYFDNPYFRGLIVRRTLDELRDLIAKSYLLYPKGWPKAKFNSQQSTWRFPSGATLWMSYVEQDKDVMRYQGQEFSWIGFDELTQHPTPYLWNYLRSRLRTPEQSGLPLMMRATTNPGGPGHGWVKRMFIDPAPAFTTFSALDENGEVMLVPEDDEDFPEERRGKPLFKRKFIPARLSDNPSLAKGGQYKANLLSLPEHERRRLLEGDWDVAEGAAFVEWRAKDHVIKPFEIPHEWRKFRSCDFGYSSFSAVHWYAIEPQTNRLYVYRELYVSKHTAAELADKILELEAGEQVSYGVLDSSCWHVRGNPGPSLAEEMILRGCKWRPSDRSPNSRISGRNRLHELLKLDEFDGKPSIQFFETCRQIISDLPVIPTDPDGTDDIDSRYLSDHAYDSIRYGIMTRPRGEDPWFKTNKPIYDYAPSDKVFGY